MADPYSDAPRRDSPRRDSPAPDRRASSRGDYEPAWRAGPRINSKWGSVARKGARSLADSPAGGPSASDLWRQAVVRAGGDQIARDRPWTPDEVWVEEAHAEEPAPARAGSGSSHPARPVAGPRDVATGKEGVASPGGYRRKVPRPVVNELESAAGADRGAKLAHRMADATYAYEKERYQDAAAHPEIVGRRGARVGGRT